MFPRIEEECNGVYDVPLYCPILSMAQHGARKGLLGGGRRFGQMEWGEEGPTWYGLVRWGGGVVWFGVGWAKGMTSCPDIFLCNVEYSESTLIGLCNLLLGSGARRNCLLKKGTVSRK